MQKLERLVICWIYIFYFQSSIIVIERENSEFLRSQYRRHFKGDSAGVWHLQFRQIVLLIGISYVFDRYNSNNDLLIKTYMLYYF